MKEEIPKLTPTPTSTTPTTIITLPWGANINCKLDYIIQILLWQNEKIVELNNNNNNGNCCDYLEPCDKPIVFIPPCHNK